MCEHPIRPDVVSKLVATGKWSEILARVSERAGHCCEYCGLDFFKSIENYKSWECDHIVPQSAGGPDEIDNIAASCRVCQFCFKRWYNPQNDAGSNATRAELIEAARRYIEKKKQEFAQQLERERDIIGYSP